MRFDEQVAVVVGGAGGIGSAVVSRLVAEGASVAIVDANGHAARVLADRLEHGGATVRAYGADVTSRVDVQRTVERIAQELGSPSLGVCATGQITPRPFLELDDETWDRTLGINLKGTYMVLQEFARNLVSIGHGGAFVAISSVAARSPRPGSVDYAAAKAGVISLVQSAAVALGSHGIRVNAVCPGIVDTEMSRTVQLQRAHDAGLSTSEYVEELIRGVPIGRIETPDDVADAILYLLSNEAGYITGQALNVCGGVAFN